MAVPRLSFRVTMRRHMIRETTVSAANMKLFHVRREHLRRTFEDEFSQFVWDASWSLAEPSTMASLLYTLSYRRVVLGESASWNWEYRGRYQDGAKSHCITEEEAIDRFTALQLDVFHALWEFYYPQRCRRHTVSMTKTG